MKLIDEVRKNGVTDFAISVEGSGLNLIVRNFMSKLTENECCKEVCEKVFRYLPEDFREKW